MIAEAFEISPKGSIGTGRLFFVAVRLVGNSLEQYCQDGHRTLNIPRWTSYGGHRAVDIVWLTSCVGYCMVDIVWWKSYAADCTLDIVQICTVNTVGGTSSGGHRTAWWASYVEHRAADIVLWTLFGVDIVRVTSYVGHGTLSIVQWTSYVEHCVLDIVW